MTTPPITTAPAPVADPDIETVEQYEDYFGFDETHTFTLPDHRQQIFFKSMTEGMRARFQKQTNRDIHFNRQTSDARLSVDPAVERWALISISVTGWSLKRRNRTGQWEDAPFSTGSPGSELNKWLDLANPSVVADLEDAIRKANPWLLDDMNVEQIDQELERLTDLRKQVIERESKEAAFQG